MNQLRGRGVLLHDVTYEQVTSSAGRLLSVDEAAEGEFDALLSETSVLAFRVAYSVLRHRQDAEDVAQEALTRAHRHFARLRARERFRSWLIRVTWRLALDRRRADRRRSARETEHFRLADDKPVQDPAHSAASAALWTAIDDLPERLRLVVVLAHIEGHQMGEVAAILGVAEGTVKSRLHEARRRLKAALA